MSEKKPAAFKTSPKQAADNLLDGLNEKPSDFWWNLAYFLILTAAIGFIIANNHLENLTSATGLSILGILIILDAFPAIYLLKLLFNLTRGGRDN
ncbi:MAG: hypothetical protein A3F83_05140 [Candidatus Glassbacteria bacterium RIFCSPLOWO2_12_FULL_58_11]|uniref:Uncharacterized protein n=2 Tax=Candidatus Glassiibacteriota TaxID=1817805 RepID=A0A1F5Z0T3_9BACT|nr:MAG: hypothetical protein A2Z86_10175 [Candidatus Glassbacteria bacterium GWA2_58_10]OGG05953.1 MAG: hypothetical protein A3F83_05140 [Candidatus Glassbacteria bacterium RIFCSPLOWO2_12_FULL_58_11]